MYGKILTTRAWKDVSNKKPKLGLMRNYGPHEDLAFPTTSKRKDRGKEWRQQAGTRIQKNSCSSTRKDQ